MRDAKDSGFSGVQIHAGHGFLFSQFLSPFFNHRTDAYGGEISNRFYIIGETIHAVRAIIGTDMAIGIKMNTTDQLQGGLTERDMLEEVRMLEATSVDLIEISGGTYFPGAPSSSDSTAVSGPYFVEFSRKAKQVTSKPVVVTGGFKTQAQVVEALETGAADAVGLARSLVMEPDLVNRWVAGDDTDPVFPRFATTMPGGVTAWYSMRLTALGQDRVGQFDLSLEEAVKAYEARDEERCGRWLKRFG